MVSKAAKNLKKAAQRRFDESKHKRDANGRFASKGSSGGKKKASTQMSEEEFAVKMSGGSKKRKPPAGQMSEEEFAARMQQKPGKGKSPAPKGKDKEMSDDEFMGFLDNVPKGKATTAEDLAIPEATPGKAEKDRKDIMDFLENTPQRRKTTAKDLEPPTAKQKDDDDDGFDELMAGPKSGSKKRSTPNPYDRMAGRKPKGREKAIGNSGRRSENPMLGEALKKSSISSRAKKALERRKKKS